MQKLIREDGNNHLTSKDYSKFTEAFSGGKLVKPEDCGHVIATLALKAPSHLVGNSSAGILKIAKNSVDQPNGIPSSRILYQNF